MLPTSSAPEVVITGGLGTASTIYCAKIDNAIRRHVPSVRIMDQPILQPAGGATLLAIEQTERFVPASVIENLRKPAQ
jgi:hypothetical protein